MNQDDSNDNVDGSHKDSKPNQSRIFVVYGSTLNTSGNVIPRPMPLCIDNDLPSTVLCFGSSNENEIAFSDAGVDYSLHNFGKELKDSYS